MSYVRDKRVEKISEMVSETLDENDKHYMLWKRKIVDLIFEYQNPHVFALQSTWGFDHNDADTIKDAIWKLIKYMFSTHPDYRSSKVWRRGWKPSEE